ncbi:MAG: hypothetical protein ABSE58_03190 [Candidatus Limnocylindrales bacterium]|jgi:hypothetical protein
MSRSDRSPRSFLRLLSAAGAVVLLAAGCVGSAATAGPSAPSGSPTVVPAGSSSTTGFYLRAWQTQALAPQNTFGWLPSVTIADGQFIDGMVAIPMIYPGPLYIALSARSVSAHGIAEIVAEATADGLLGSATDFSAGAAPGSVTAHVELVVDGVTHDLTGPMPTDATQTSNAPGTAAAFSAFWNRIGNLNGWLGSELGQSTPYVPANLAVMIIPPAAATSGITPNETRWPLSGKLATFGTPMSVTPYRCGVVSGADLTTLLPVVESSNALARFVDSAGVKMSLQVRVLVPGEPSPCS